MSVWIRFEHFPPKPGRKTSHWIVKPKKLGEGMLGLVKWWPAWRKYVFFPVSDTLFEEDCLHAIAEFIDEETRKYKGK